MGRGVRGEEGDVQGIILSAVLAIGLGCYWMRLGEGACCTQGL